MLLHSIASAVPAATYPQADTLRVLRACDGWGGLKERSRQLVERILMGDGGIAQRSFVCADAGRLFNAGAGELNREFERAAPELAGRALDAALEKAGVAADHLDALFICTCTGYLCPGLSSYVAEQRGLREDALLHDIVGLGCGAALPALRSAAHFLKMYPRATVAVIAVEVCSLAFYINDDPGVLISLCLFGDGASASLWRGEDAGAATPWRASGFRSLHLPEHREKIRFANENGKLKNQLHRSVPELAAAAVARLAALDAQEGWFLPETRVIAHTGGRDVVAALRAALPGQALEETSAVLSSHGNMSSPSVLFALERALAGQPDCPLWLTAFGAGFTAHSCRLER